MNDQLHRASESDAFATNALYRFMPSISQWIGLLILIGSMSVLWRQAMVGSDGDACMHRRVGEWMLETGQVMRTEVFSHTHEGRPVIIKEWVAAILFALAGRWDDLFGMCLLAVVTIAVTFSLMHRQLLREGNDLMMSTLLVLMACWASSIHWMARPHVFSFLLMFVWNDALRRLERDARFGPVLAVMMGLMLVWVNTHGAWLAGFFVLAAYWLGAAIEWATLAGTEAGHQARARLGRLTLIGAACAVVSLANPNGAVLHWHNAQFLQSKFFTGWLAEYASLDFRKAHSLGFMAWLALTFLVLTVLRPRLRPSAMVLMAMWTYFALYAGRNVPLYVIIIGPVIAPALSDCVGGRLRAVSERWKAMSLASRGWPVVAALAALWWAVTPKETVMPVDRWPHGALAHVRSLPERYRGNMFNQYLYGGYLMWYLPEHKVFVDGRADFYGESFVKEFDRTARLKPGWMDTFEKYKIEWTLLPVEHRLNTALSLLPGWERTYADEVAVIYRRRS